MPPETAAPTLEDLQRELTIQRMRSAQLEVRLTYPGLPEKLLGFYQGPPEGLPEYAKNLHEELSKLAPSNPPSPEPAPVVVTAPLSATPVPNAGSAVQVAPPAPAPGPGVSVTPDTADRLRLTELREAALDKRINVRNFDHRNNEAEEYFDRAMVDGLLRSGVVRRKVS